MFTYKNLVECLNSLLDKIPRKNSDYFNENEINAFQNNFHSILFSRIDSTMVDPFQGLIVVKMFPSKVVHRANIIKLRQISIKWIYFYSFLLMNSLNKVKKNLKRIRNISIICFFDVVFCDLSLIVFLKYWILTFTHSVKDNEAKILT